MKEFHYGDTGERRRERVRGEMYQEKRMGCPVVHFEIGCQNSTPDPPTRRGHLRPVEGRSSAHVTVDRTFPSPRQFRTTRNHSPSATEPDMATSPEQAEATMIANLKEKTGKTLEQWVKIGVASKLAKHGEIVKHLK